MGGDAVPARLIGFDTASGATRVGVCGDADDAFIDDAGQRVDVVCGDGQIDVVHDENGRAKVDGRIATAAGARTGLFVPQLGRLFVADAARSGSAAEVRIYEAR